MYKLILASQSPRRRQILMDAGYNFQTDIPKVSEIIDENLNLEVAIQNLAQTKAEDCVRRIKSLEKHKVLILAADTIVSVDGQVLGKPKSKNEAIQFLNLLSNKTHSVITAICVHDLDNCQSVTAAETTQVHILKLSQEDVQDYIATGEPMDKAGAYAIQGIGKKFVKSFEGSWTNVVGLPLELFENLLIKNGWKVDKSKPTKNPSSY